MKTLALTLLICLTFDICIGQVSDSTIIVLDPFEVRFDLKLSTEIQDHVNNSQKILDKFFVDSLTKKANHKEALLISRLKKYQSNFDIGAAFSFFYVGYLHSKLAGRYELVPLRQKSSGNIEELKKVALANNSRWVINIAIIDFYVDDNEEFSMSPNGNKGRVKIQLFDSKTSSIEFNQEIKGDTSGIQWFLRCNSGEFKCIVNHLVGNSTYELAEYFVR
jgi:hypothetical protein